MKGLLIAVMAAMATLAAAQQPAADHHTHIMSPTAVKLVNDPPLPEIELPADLARLLRAKENGWQDKAALAGLYTEDSVVFDFRETRWMKGRDDVATYLSKNFARPFRITPIAYGVDGNAGHIAAYFTRGEGDAARHFGHALFSLQKGADGAWRIAAEYSTFPGPQVREPGTAEQLIAQLDEAGIRYGAVLSSAYWHGSPLMRKIGGDEYANVRAENDWTIQEVSRFPDRLVAFCSFNPLKDYALQEIERCARSDPSASSMARTSAPRRRGSPG